MKTIFRIGRNDTIKAYAISSKTKQILSSLYDSNFSTIKEIERTLLRKIPYYGGSKIDIQIFNSDKNKSKYYSIKVNQ